VTFLCTVLRISSFLTEFFSTGSEISCLASAGSFVVELIVGLFSCFCGKGSLPFDGSLFGSSISFGGGSFGAEI